MIIIKDIDFEMEQVKNLPFFDLKLPTVINEGKPNERTEMKVVGHAMPFKACVNEIIMHRLGIINEVYDSINEFVNTYIQEFEKIKSSKQVSFIEIVSKKDKKDEEDEKEETNEEDLIDENNGERF